MSLDLQSPLGHGTDGSVWRTSHHSAVKALVLEKLFITELECYQRFKAQGITKIRGFSVPMLLGASAALLVIEMKIVTPPYILDFAKAHLDQPAEFSQETWEDWHEQGHELFEGNWKEVKLLLAELKQFGIYYYDAKPQNIRFITVAD